MKRHETERHQNVTIPNRVQTTTCRLLHAFFQTLNYNRIIHYYFILRP